MHSLDMQALGFSPLTPRSLESEAAARCSAVASFAERFYTLRSQVGDSSHPAGSFVCRPLAWPGST